jgi:RNA polymerase sigma factor (sigma-70 family)
MPNSLDERDLVQRCIRGDRDAWEALCAGTQHGVTYAIIRTLKTYRADVSEPLVEDLRSRLYLGLMTDDARRLRQFRGDAALATWLRVRATNLTIDTLRRRRNTVSFDHLDEHHAAPATDADAAPDRAAERAELIARLRQFFDALSDADAEFARRYFVEQRSFDEIQALTGASAGALYARKCRIQRQITEMARADGWLDLHADRSAS